MEIIKSTERTLMESKRLERISLITGEMRKYFIEIEKVERFYSQWPQVSLSRLSQFKQEFKGIRHPSTTRPKHDATAALLRFVCTSEIINLSQ